MHTVLARFLKDCDAEQLVRKVFLNYLSLNHTAGDLNSGRSRDSNRLGLLCRWRQKQFKPGEFCLQEPGWIQIVQTENIIPESIFLIVICNEVCLYLNFFAVSIMLR